MPEITPDSSNKKKALGRGLGSLLGGTSTGPLPAPQARESLPTSSLPAQPSATVGMVVEGKVWQVAIDKLQPGAFQPRQHFSKASLDELALSIKANGILQPITARKTSNPSKFEIVAGERRWRAAQLAGLHEVPVLIKSYTDKESLELAIIENVQREDLDPIEEAEAYSRLMSDFSLSQQQVSEKVGKERATVANAIRLLALPQDVKDMIRKQDLTVGHAKVLLAIEDKAQLVSLARRVSLEKIPVRRLEKIIQEVKSMPVNQATKLTAEDRTNENVTLRLIKGLSEELQRTLGTRVNIDYQESKGKISVYFYSDDELTKIVDRLKGINT